MIFSEPSIGIKNKKQTVILYDCPLVVTSDNDVCRADAFAIFCSDARVYVARRRRTNDGPSVIKRSLKKSSDVRGGCSCDLPYGVEIYSRKRIIMTP